MWLPLLGAFFIGLSKSGFATGLGMLTTPLVASAMTARQAIGIVLPLLCVADALTMGLFWKKWDAAAVKWPLVGTLGGIALGMLFVNRVSNKTLGLAIGIVGLTMVMLLMVRSRWYPDHVYQPRVIDRLAIGVVCGFSSTIAHAAGPIFALFLIAQQLPKDTFIATNAVFFTINNLLKAPPYLASGLITWETLRMDLYLLPALPVGILAGWGISRLLTQKHFEWLVEVLLVVTSLHLIVSGVRG
jgi:uncharacterized membrane protein YfcA